MSTITLTIGGRDYAIACDDGEEAHLHRLGQIIDEKLQAMSTTAPQSENRGLLFAALMLADELQELHAKPNAPTANNSVLDTIADRLEQLATALEPNNITP